eukprot:scpid78983/ scgid30266/ 
MSERSVVSQRLVCDHVSSVGGLGSVGISPALIRSATAAHQQYRAHLEEEKRKAQAAGQANKRKALLQEIDDVKKKQKQLRAEVTELFSSADKFPERAESSSDLAWIVKSNSLRCTAKSKEAELGDLAQVLQEKQNAVKLA